MKVALVAALLAAAAPAHHKKAAPQAATPPISATGTLFKADLLRIVVGSMKSKGDAFTGDFGSRFVGRHFWLVQKLYPDNGSEYPENNARWSYDIDGETLRMFVKDAQTFEIFYKDRATGSYVGSNAFGVKRRIQASNETTAGVSADSYDPARKLTYSAPLPSAQARAAVANTVFVVEGDLSSDGGKTVNCESSGGGNATIDDPTDVSYFNCSVHAHISRMAFENASDQKVIAEWTDAAKEPAAVEKPVVSVDTTPLKASAVTWARKPSTDDFAMYMPERALRLRKSGQATARCTVHNTLLTGCSILSETPSDYGFGDATIKVMLFMKTAASDPNGHSYEGRQIDIPLNFSTTPG